jgi:hypothetical protein
MNPDLGKHIKDNNLSPLLLFVEDISNSMITYYPSEKIVSVTVTLPIFEGTYCGTIEAPFQGPKRLAPSFARQLLSGIKLRAAPERAYSGASGEHVIPLWPVDVTELVHVEESSEFNRWKIWEKGTPIGESSRKATRAKTASPKQRKAKRKSQQQARAVARRKK